MGDDDALQQVFDIIILGTGHAESIVAAAASKAGKSVLHVDAQAYYGSTNAALSLRQLESLAIPPPEGETASASGPTMPAAHATAAPGHVASIHHQQRDGLEFFGDLRSLPEQLRNIASRITVDLVPSLLFSVGKTVDALRGSGASVYAEFKSLDSAWVIDSTGSGEERPPQSRSSASDVAGVVQVPPQPARADSDPCPAPALQAWEFHKVPSSKADVFSAPISLLEKRLLMKFLQFALEHAAAGDDAAVTRLNETTLGQGRSLKRPQNKAPQAFPVDSYAGRPFADFLGGPCGLSKAVQRQIMFGVALLCDPPGGTVTVGSDSEAVAASTTHEGMSRLSSYVLSLGRFGSSAFLAPMYGHGELAQAFCRVCAVHGGIYVLNKPVTGVFLSSNTLGAEGSAARDADKKDCAAEVAAPPRPWRIGITTADGISLRAVSVLAAPSYALSPLEPESPECGGEGRGATLVPPPSTPFPGPHTALGVCLVIASAPLLSLARGLRGRGGPPPSDAGRDSLACATVPPLLPPARHQHTVHVLQQGHANGAAPPGYFVLHCWTHAHAAPGTAGDGSGEAAARAAACAAAQATMAAIVDCAAAAVAGEAATAPLWQCSYSFATRAGWALRGVGQSSGAAREPPIWLSLRPPAAATLHDAESTAAAEEAWGELFPGLPLWSPSPGEGQEEGPAPEVPAAAAAEGTTGAMPGGPSAMVPGGVSGGEAAPSAPDVQGGGASRELQQLPVRRESLEPRERGDTSSVPVTGDDKAAGANFDVFAALALLRDDD